MPRRWSLKDRIPFLNPGIRIQPARSMRLRVPNKRGQAPRSNWENPRKTHAMLGASPLLLVILRQAQWFKHGVWYDAVRASDNSSVRPL